MAADKPIRGKNGGARPGAGRKPRIIEEAFSSKLKVYEPEMLEILIARARAGDATCIKLYFAYMVGNPTTTINSNVNATVNNIQLKDIISFDKDPDNDDFTDFEEI
jgi:hypothetical protein